MALEISESCALNDWLHAYQLCHFSGYTKVSEHYHNEPVRGWMLPRPARVHVRRHDHNIGDRCFPEHRLAPNLVLAIVEQSPNKFTRAEEVL